MSRFVSTNTQHSAQMMAQVPPCKAAMMSKASLFQRLAFLIREVLVLSKDATLAVIQGSLAELIRGPCEL